MFRRAAVVILAVAAPCAAQPGTVYRLTPAEIAAVAAPPVADPLFDHSLFDDDPPRSRRVHGEVGAFVGTGGARGVFGSAAVPLGSDGFAAFAFEHSDGRRRR